MPDDAKAAWLERVLGYRLPSAAPDALPPTDLKRALQSWQAARAGVVTQLRDLSGAVSKGGDPEGTAAIILLQAIIKNLTQSPATRRQVQELERYVTTDSIIGEAESPNGYGLTVSIRMPLLPVLATLKAAVPA